MSEQKTDHPGSVSDRRGRVLQRRFAGGALAAGALSGCLTFTGGSAFALTGHPQIALTRGVLAAPAATRAQDVAAFYRAGYTYHDALALAALWASPTVYDAKVRAGGRLLAGRALPRIPRTFTSQQDVNAFYADGYDYQTALELAAVWGTPSVYQAKDAAGAELLAGRPLPKIPSTFTSQQDVNAFYADGYDYQTALELAAIWGTPSVYQAKDAAGAELLAGRPLPKIPSTFTSQQDVNAFYADGYDYQTALELAAVWGTPSVYQAKDAAGAELLAGRPLPKIPSTFTSQQDVNAFAAAGYTYADAVRLAHLWHSASPHSAEARGGAKLLAGGTLPIQP